MSIKVLGIDLAKKVFQLHGVDHKGHTILQKKLPRRNLMEFIATLPPCTIFMEACSSANGIVKLLNILIKLGQSLPF